MTTYLLASLTKSLLEPQFIPIGVVLHDQDQTEVRLMPEPDIPDKYKPVSQLSRAVLQNLDCILRATWTCSHDPTNLYFTEITPAESTGTLAEQAERLFKEQVLTHYVHLPKTI